jgi:S1-C subfamily serine protease
MINTSKYFETLFALFAAALVSWMSAANAQDSLQYSEAFSQAARTAADRVLPSIVTVEPISTGGARSGEVQLDTPTSGLVIDPDGYILTSSLPVQGSGATILVTLSDGTRASATVAARDFHRELALLKIDSKEPLRFAALSTEPLDLKIGQTTIAVARYGPKSTPMMARGILSAVKRLDGIALQTDARISPTFYGGPLVDLYGRVLGIMIPAVGEGGAENPTDWYDSGIAFAIDASTIASKLDRLKAGTDIKQGLIGMVASSKDPNEKNTTISAVRPRSPADAAGMKAGDRVLSIAGTNVDRHGAIKQALGRHDSGETITVVVDREGKSVSLEITLADEIPPLIPQRLGALIRVATTENEEKDDTEPVSKIIVRELIAGTPGAEKLKTDDVITAIGDTEINSIERLRSQLITAEPEKSISLRIVRDGKKQSIDITPQSQTDSPLIDLPVSLQNSKTKGWQATKLKLPEAATEAALIGPSDAMNNSKDSQPGSGDSGQDITETPYGLVMLLGSPGDNDAIKLAESWVETAAKSGTIVCIVVSENSQRWQLNELETIRGFAAAAKKRFQIADRAVAVAPLAFVGDADATAADTMALAALVSMPELFAGAAISPETTPPAVRLRENTANTAQQVLMRVTQDEEMPAFATLLSETGYPIQREAKLDRGQFLVWVRLLQSI